MRHWTQKTTGHGARAASVCWHQFSPSTWWLRASLFYVVGKFHSHGTLRAPNDMASMGAAVRGNAEDELVRNGAGFHTCNLGATI